ncbi:uncharacterized protein si:dkey-11f4.20 [Austrofundulus limnaeus]|uniref:Uncharacterized protein si:dkey-11f4.20 n=1 Tax=Austrofundulus limnaeus TaxID=52670 RepID=A0A2I4C8E7_AUSLI|nr:PREDICTED: uncharacterized protein LOC106526250 [Austrofundulus limnaeus]
MAHFVVAVGLILLPVLIDLSAGNNTCNLYAAVGESLTLPFAFGGLGNTHSLRWTHNKTIIFTKQKGRVTKGKPEDINATGSILLKNVGFSSAGIYEANISHSNGTIVKAWMDRLCVMEKVSKPRLDHICDSSAVNFSCNVAKPQGLDFSWTLNKKTLLGETKQTLRISLSHLKEERTFACSVANKVSVESSETVRPACKAPLLCFKPQVVVAVLAGGAGLIFFLLIAVVALCCCVRRTKPQTNPRDKQEIKMLSVKKQEAEPISPEYEAMHNIQSSPSPSPKPSPRACYKNVSQPYAQTDNRPLQMFPAAEGQRSSPVPKPRTKNAQTLNI